MKYLLIFLVITGCASISYRQDTLMPDDTVITTRFSYYRLFNQRIQGLEVKKGDTVVNLDSQVADNDEILKAINKNADLLDILIKAVMP